MSAAKLCLYNPWDVLCVTQQKNESCEIVEFPFCIVLFLCERFNHISGAQHILVFPQNFFGQHKFLSLRPGVVFV